MVSADQVSVVGNGTTFDPLRAGDVVTLVFNPFAFSPTGVVFTDFAELMATKATIADAVSLQFDNTRQGIGAGLTIAEAGVMALAQGNPATPFSANMVGRSIMISGDPTAANNQTFTITAVIDAFNLEFANASGVASPGFSGVWVVVGGGGSNNVVLPPEPSGGRWDMTQVEWFGFSNPYSAPGLGAIPVVISDGCAFTNLRKIGGDLAITNLNNTLACVPVTDQVVFELGLGDQGDFPTLANNGLAPFFDCTTLVTGQIFSLRLAGQITGTSPAVQFGASPAVLNFNIGTFGRFRAGMAAGTNPAALCNVANLGEQNEFGRQSAWSGTVAHGSQSGLLSGSGGTNIPRLRRQLFPISLQQAAPVATGVAFVNATGLGHNGSYEITTNTALLAQTLPVIRASAPPIGSAGSVPGALDSTGMRVTFKHIGTGSISISPAAGETIDHGAGPLVVPTGGARELESDGVSNWRVVGGYL